METIYIGVDFHARQQTICYLKTETGELVFHELKHQDKEVVRAFYAQFVGQVIVGLEASGYSPWFERMLEELGCQVWLGHATENRRRARWRQKNDRREHWLQLMEALTQQLLETMVWFKSQSKDDDSITRLRTHPGIGLLTSLCIVHTLQPVSRFRNTRKVAAYAGFDPIERSSAERKCFLGISKAGSRLLRYLLVEAAQTAVRKDEDLKRFYQRLADRRGRPKAKVAAARKLLIRAYIMMRDEIDYAEFRHRAVAARLARRSQGPANVPEVLIGQPASPEQ